MLQVAKARHPDRIVQFVSQEEDDDAVWFVTLTPTPEPTDNFKQVAVDARTAEVLAHPKTDEGFMFVMLKLHVDLFAGLPGKLFLGFMGFLLLVAIVSGVVLYSPSCANWISAPCGATAGHASSGWTCTTCSAS